MKPIFFFTLKVIVVLFLCSTILAQNEVDSPIGFLSEETGLSNFLPHRTEENPEKRQSIDNRQSGATRPPIVSAILGSLTVLTATLTLYRFIESRGARERQAQYYSLVDELANMLEALSSKTREQETNLKAFECRYEIERGNLSPGCEEYATLSNPKAAQQIQSSELAAVDNSPEAEVWFKGLRNVKRNGRRLSETIKTGYIGL